MAVNPLHTPRLASTGTVARHGPECWPDMLRNWWPAWPGIRNEEEERLEQERRERREAHAKLIADLEQQAGAWHRARFLRRYVQAARRILKGQRVQAHFRDETIDFLDWAAAYVDHLDPLSVTPHNPDLTSEPHYYYRSNDEVLKESLQRVFGINCQHARKLLRAALTDTNAEGLENV